MNINKFFYISIILSALSQHVFAETNMIKFQNERGSILELNRLADNKLEGFFTTAVASKSCPEATNQRRPITGYVVGNALTFSVVYPMCESVVSITGNFSNNEEAIDTLSILNKQSSDVTHEGPGARFIGHDSYKRIS